MSRISSSSSLRANTSSSSDGRNLLGRFLGTACREPFELQQVLDPRDRLLQGPIRVVQIRRALETRAAFRRRRVEEVVRMKLPAQAAEPLLEIVGADVELARQPEKREVVAVPADRQDLRALRAEVRVDGRAAAAITADLKCGRGLGSHDAKVPCGTHGTWNSGTSLTPRTNCRSRRSTSRSGC